MGGGKRCTRRVRIHEIDSGRWTRLSFDTVTDGRRVVSTHSEREATLPLTVALHGKWPDRPSRIRS